MDMLATLAKPNVSNIYRSFSSSATNLILPKPNHPFFLNIFPNTDKNILIT